METKFVCRSESLRNPGLNKWLDCFTRLPFLVCELGGDRGRDFCIAFLLMFSTQIGLTSAIRAQLEGAANQAGPHCQDFRQHLEHAQRNHRDNKCECNTSTHQHCDTLGLLTVMLTQAGKAEAIQMALGSRKLHELPCLYQFACIRIYSVKTDQQSGESAFSVADAVRNNNMSA